METEKLEFVIRTMTDLAKAMHLKGMPAHATELVKAMVEIENALKPDLWAVDLERADGTGIRVFLKSEKDAMGIVAVFAMHPAIPIARVFAPTDYVNPVRSFGVKKTDPAPERADFEVLTRFTEGNPDPQTIHIGFDSLVCRCKPGDPCPLGKHGVDERCTAVELIKAGFRVSK